jgi:hypothetical protein
MFGLLKGEKSSENDLRDSGSDIFGDAIDPGGSENPYEDTEMATQPETPVKRPRKRTLVEDSPNTPTPSTQVMRITDGKTPMDTEIVMDRMYRLVEELRYVTDKLDEQSAWYERQLEEKDKTKKKKKGNWKP